MERIDTLLVKKGLFPSRQKGIEAIKNGEVMADGKVVTKPSEKFSEDVDLKTTSNILKYVSRGGFKLEKAIEQFCLNFDGKTILDMGSSTGGFTDCALKYGALKVFAVDVGSSQLVEGLRKDARVVSMENTDVRNLDKSLFDECDYIVGDLSFISIVKILEAIKDKISTQSLVLLIKPQFECGIEEARKYKGVILDYNLSKKILNETLTKIKTLGFNILGVADSPIKGGDGNAEFVTLIKK